MSRSSSWVWAVVFLGAVMGGGEAVAQYDGEGRRAASGRHLQEGSNGRAMSVAGRPSVYLFRGIFDVYSLGMDDLVGKLRARGIAASAYGHIDWQAVADAIIAQNRAGSGGPIALIGHSLGGGAAISLAEALGQAGIAVDLVVPIDPVMAPPVPPNVRHAVNYYQSGNGYGQPVGAAAGFRGVIVNADLETNRRDLRHEGLSHTNIDKSPQIHAEIIRQVLSLRGGRGR